MARRLTPHAAAPSLDDYKLIEKMAFLSSWSPTSRRTRRWSSWAAYVEDYRALRPQLLQAFRSGQRSEFGPLFGDRVLAFVERHGLAALDRASYADIRYADDDGGDSDVPHAA